MQQHEHSQRQRQQAFGADLPLELLQHVTDSLALHADGNFEATQWLLQLRQHPQMQQLLQWLLHPFAVFPPRYDEAAKLVGLQLLLEAIKRHWHTDWEEPVQNALKEVVLQLLQQKTLQQQQPDLRLLPPAAAAAAASPTPRVPAFSILMKASQCLASACCCSKSGAAAAATTRQMLLKLASHALGLSEEELRQSSALCDPTVDDHKLLALVTQQQQAFVSACVFLGVLLEICLELNEESSSLMSCLSGKLRRQVAQALHKEIGSSSSVLLQLSRCMLLLYSSEASARARLQPLALDCIRCLAALGDVAAVLRCLCCWGLGGAEFQGAEGLLLQALDVVNERLVKKRQKKQAIDGVSVESMTAFCCLLLQSAASVLALPVTEEFVEEEALRHFDSAVLGALLRSGILRVAMHPSVRVACHGIAAAAALLRKMAIIAASEETAPQQQQREPQWLDIRALLAVTFVRCLRVGDPQILKLLQPAAVAALDDVSLRLLSAVALYAEAEDAIARDPMDVEQHRSPQRYDKSEECVFDGLLRVCAAASGQAYELADKNQPCLFPSCILLDGCCSFVEALVQRLKSACLTAAAAQQGSAAAASAACAVWLLPQNAAESPWLRRLCRIFEGLVRIPLFDASCAAASVNVAEHAKAAAAAARSVDSAAATVNSSGVSLHDYFLEMRRLEFVSGASHLLNYSPPLDIKSILDLLFRHILSTETAASQIDNIWAYPLPAPQQVHLCKRRALQTLICISSAGASAIQQYLPALLQHVQAKIHASDNEQQQQQHTLPLIEPFAAALSNLLTEAEQQKQVLLQQDPGDAAAAALVLPPTTALIFYLFGDVRRKQTSQEEELAARRRRTLARVLSALESSIKRTTVPSDSAAARAGGYAVECSTVSAIGLPSLKVSSLTEEDAELRKPFPQRHPLASLVQHVLPTLFKFMQTLQQLWTDEVNDAYFVHLRELLLPGADEFLAIQGTSSALAGNASALSRAVLLAFPCSSSGRGDGSTDGIGEREAAVLLTRRHCYHLRTLAYRLGGTCAAVADGFFLMPDLGERLREVLLVPMREQLPLQHVEQLIRFFWCSVLEAESLPPQPPYPSQQRVYALSNVGDVLLQHIGALLHHKSSSMVAVAAASSSSSSGPKPLPNASASRLHSGVAVSASPVDDEDTALYSRQESNASLPCSGSSSSASELRLRVYYNAALLQPLVAAVLELQRWPIPSLVQQGHKYITGADAAGSGASLLLDYTGSIYQLLKALVQNTGETAKGTESNSAVIKQQAAAAVADPRTAAALNLFRTNELAHPLSGEEVELLLTALLQSEAKDGKGILKRFLPSETLPSPLVCVASSVPGAATATAAGPASRCSGTGEATSSAEGAVAAAAAVVGLTLLKFAAAAQRALTVLGLKFWDSPCEQPLMPSARTFSPVVICDLLGGRNAIDPSAGRQRDVRGASHPAATTVEGDFKARLKVATWMAPAAAADAAEGPPPSAGEGERRHLEEVEMWLEALQEAPGELLRQEAAATNQGRALALCVSRLRELAAAQETYLDQLRALEKAALSGTNAEAQGDLQQQQLNLQQVWELLDGEATRCIRRARKRLRKLRQVWGLTNTGEGMPSENDLFESESAAESEEDEGEASVMGGASAEEETDGSEARGELQSGDEGTEEEEEEEEAGEEKSAEEEEVEEEEEGEEKSAEEEEVEEEVEEEGEEKSAEEEEIEEEVEEEVEGEEGTEGPASESDAEDDDAASAEADDLLDEIEGREHEKAQRDRSKKPKQHQLEDEFFSLEAMHRFEESELDDEEAAAADLLLYEGIDPSAKGGGGAISYEAFYSESKGKEQSKRRLREHCRSSENEIRDVETAEESEEVEGELKGFASEGPLDAEDRRLEKELDRLQALMEEEDRERREQRRCRRKREEEEQEGSCGSSSEVDEAPMAAAVAATPPNRREDDGDEETVAAAAAGASGSAVAISTFIERIVKGRIEEALFDDVQRKALPNKPSGAGSNKAGAAAAAAAEEELNMQKPAEGLGDLYAREYQEKLLGAPSQQQQQLDAEKRQLLELFGEVMYKCDALTNAQFVPRPVAALAGSAEGKGAPAAVRVEEAVPVFVPVDRSGNKGSLPETRKTAEETTQEERRAERRRKKEQRQKQLRKRIDSGELTLQQARDRQEHLQAKNKAQKVERAQKRRTGLTNAEAIKELRKGQKRVKTVQLLADAARAKAAKAQSRTKH
ncbi:hypothetical protein cyc_01249 [Cyclospora cayetanensis]|uniref:Uncharacterized protein n=1 Tax=Cyclospora cayetanensis TaxID=88456 RepID=A0A1D3D1W0_9EIME|nr:hypothetical protein cyc_01249 [Cyclospora cayetanensis]